MDELVLIEIYKIFHSTDSKYIFPLKHIEPFPKLTTQDTSQISINKKKFLVSYQTKFSTKFEINKRNYRSHKNLGD